ncbi:putative inactive poly [ADP-ribose] polymerase SRO3 [Tasmannia lanceolata]|uniref:putative inactive poly [ADP-ribose] polymerase SRO3 n=1 Tax=Tasmannia lanceolata TaxID=3420 RepID=UPI00406284BB
MFYSHSEWSDYPYDNFQVLKTAFVSGFPSTILEIQSHRYLIDFLRMLQTDLTSGSERSIAWIDVSGKCFFPCSVHQPIAEEKGETQPPTSNKRVRISQEEEDVIPAVDVACIVKLDFNLIGMKLNEESVDYKKIKNIFMKGMREMDKKAKVTAIHCCLYKGAKRIERLQEFRRYMRLTELLRGDANVAYGWYGGSPQAVENFILHGFGELEYGRLHDGSSSKVGAYLYHEDYSHVASASHSEPDIDNEFHLVLCNVILGYTEQISEGSDQFGPSSGSFDNGVDDLRNPKRYLVWKTHMRTHILPRYAVSFTATKLSQGSTHAASSPSNKCTRTVK